MYKETKGSGLQCHRRHKNNGRKGGVGGGGGRGEDDALETKAERKGKKKRIQNTRKQNKTKQEKRRQINRTYFTEGATTERNHNFSLHEAGSPDNARCSKEYVKLLLDRSLSAVLVVTGRPLCRPLTSSSALIQTQNELKWANRRLIP